jgi:predicted alpha/beta hydrolase family esterase
MADDVFLVLHGWGGNKPEHWQEHLVGKLKDAGKRVHYPKMPDPTAPDLNAWLTRVQGEIEEIQSQTPDAPLTVLTHSLGSITWMHLAASGGAGGKQVADRALLVAPPYVLPEAPPPDAPPSVTAFFPPPLDPAAIKAIARETVIVASDTDDYATFDQTSGYAAKLSVPIHLLKGAGHISPYYGYGEWPWVLEWCLKRADLPPQPRS